MKTKFLSIIFMLISLSLAASHEHLSLTDVISGSHFYYCSTTVDSVIVHKPAGSGIGDWYHSELGSISADSVIITLVNEGYWYFDAGVMIIFYVNFTSISPTEAWLSTDTTKCTEIALILKGQETSQADFGYAWSPGGSTASQITANVPGIYYVTVTGACGMINDQIEVFNYPVPQPNLGADVFTCHGNTITLTPGIFDGYLWSTGVSTSTIEVTTSSTYSVIVADVNGCHGSDTVVVDFTFNDGEEILLLSIDTTSGNVEVAWETNGSDVTTVIFREMSTEMYAQVGISPYGNGRWVDDVNSINQTHRYKISTIDTCGNESEQSFYHQTISTATIPLVPNGYRVEWTEYLVEGTKTGTTKSVSNYYVFAVDGLGLDWSPTQIAAVAGSVTSYNLPSINDSLFVVGAEISGGKSLTTGLALSNVVDNPLISGIPSIVAVQNVSVYPNPSNGVCTVRGQGLLSVSNVYGQCISQDNIYGTKVITLNSGIYFVRITGKNNIITTQKVIIQ